MIINELTCLLPRFAVLSLLKVKKKKGKKKPPMRDAPRAIFQDLRGPAMESLGTGREGVKAFFTFLLLKATAGNSERSSDGCEEGDCNL